MNVPQVGVGRVRHTRLRPVHHAFAYPACFLMLPMRSMERNGAGALARNRFAPLSFHDADHGDGRANALEWLLEVLRNEGITDADGEIWLQCLPRFFGFAFKPVSFWFCHRADGTLAAVLAEVHNTFGERHSYLLSPTGWGGECSVRKAFHVSPFCDVRGTYRFRFLVSAARGRSVVRIDYDDGEGPLLQTSLSGDLQPATCAALRRVVWQQPAHAIAVVARIHWQALQLWLRRVPWFSKPAPPNVSTSR